MKLHDVRNTRDGKGFYAACRSARVTRDYEERVTNRVDMVLGRAFFSGAIPKRPKSGGFNAQQAYSATSDATLGTFVHELAHGTFRAVDAPPVRPNGAWVLQPNVTPGDRYGASPNNNIQSSTPVLDKRLAEKDPTIAVRNADCYGQFAREYMSLVTASKG